MLVEQKEYVVFKGLQKPLVFKGYKGKFIYWIAGGLLGSFILCIVFTILIHIAVGILTLAIGTGSIIMYVKSQMKYGVNKKELKKGVVFIDSNFIE